ncbi:MAG: shikimate kinase [archaeon]|nr:shikimate kinase [archaeon]
MENKSNIALIGFRGTGKTQIGKRLAKRLNMDFFDTDKEIIRETGKTIPEIFEQSGEAGFREIEKEVIKRVSTMDNVCISCGGGVILFEENIINLRKNAIIILLESEAKIIYRRIKRDRNRPALTEKEGIEEVKHLLSEREHLYQRSADYKVDTSYDSLDNCVQKIIDVMNEAGLL